MQQKARFSSVLLSDRTWVETQVVKEKFKQTPGDRNIAILRYLKKFDGDWKNVSEINRYQKGSFLNPGRLTEILLDLDDRGFIEKRDSENPQARPYEYSITKKGKEKLERLMLILSDPDLKHLAGLKREISDKDEFHEI